MSAAGNMGEDGSRVKFEGRDPRSGPAFRRIPEVR
jgi:hypothetical protein